MQSSSSTHMSIKSKGMVIYAICIEIADAFILSVKPRSTAVICIYNNYICSQKYVPSAWHVHLLFGDLRRPLNMPHLRHPTLYILTSDNSLLKYAHTSEKVIGACRWMQTRYYRCS